MHSVKNDTALQFALYELREKHNELSFHLNDAYDISVQEKRNYIQQKGNRTCADY